jgi:hypothetical protein
MDLWEQPYHRDQKTTRLRNIVWHQNQDQEAAVFAAKDWWQDFPKEKSRERRDQQQDDIQNARATRISASSKTARVRIRAKNGGALSTNQESIGRKTGHWSSTQIKYRSFAWFLLHGKESHSIRVDRQEEFPRRTGDRAGRWNTGNKIRPGSQAQNTRSRRYGR